MIKKIKKRNGRIVDFSSSRIRDAVQKAFLAVELENGGRSEEVTEDIVTLLNSRFGDRIPSVENIQNIVVEVLAKNGYKRVAEEYQIYRKKKSELRKLKNQFGLLEPKLTVNALEVLRQRYLLKDANGKIIETPSRLFTRIAKTISAVDKKYKGEPEKNEKIFYDMMVSLQFMPNSPTLFNAGVKLGQLSACFVLPVRDSLKGIFSSLMNMALIEQTGGGVGFNFSRKKNEIPRNAISFWHRTH